MAHNRDGPLETLNASTGASLEKERPGEVMLYYSLSTDHVVLKAICFSSIWNG